MAGAGGGTGPGHAGGWEGWFRDALSAVRPTTVAAALSAETDSGCGSSGRGDVRGVR
jgi:hypothetical protein